MLVVLKAGYLIFQLYRLVVQLQIAGLVATIVLVAEVAMAELVDRVFKIKPLAVVPGLLDIVAMEAGEDMQVPVPLRDLAEVVGAVPKVIAFRLFKREEEVEE